MESPSHFLLLLIVFITFFSFSFCNPSRAEDSSYYQLCGPFDCGNITFGFPFSPLDSFGSGPFDCGLPRFQISCDPTTSSPALDLSGRTFAVKDLFLKDNLITLFDHRLIDDLRLGTCRSLRNLSASSSATDIPSLSLPQSVINLTFFECPHGFSPSEEFLEGIVGNYSCGEREGYGIYLWDSGTQRGPPGVIPVETPSGCEVVMVPGSGASLSRYGFFSGSGDNRRMEPLFDVLSDRFPLEWPALDDCASCEETGGRCGFDGSSKRIVCFCKGGCVNQ